MIYDDDCDADVDCAITQPIIHHWIDLGYLKVWGMVSSAPSELGAPTMTVFQNYYRHSGSFPIGALRPNCQMHASASWNARLIGQFNSGDVCSNYLDCASVLRQSVASYVADGGKANGLVYVITGPLSCEEKFRTSAPDAISPLTGAQMEQQFIKQFVLMNGCVSSGGQFACTAEYNCDRDVATCSAFFANVRNENGYPPVYVLPLNTGAFNVRTQVPLASLPVSNPTACAFNSVGRSEAADEDALAIEYSVFGETGWSISSNVTSSVNLTTLANSWQTGAASGQYYLTLAMEPGVFETLISPPWLPKSN